MGERRVFVTGLGAVSPAGASVDAFRDALRAGVQGARPVTAFSTASFRSRTAATVREFDPKQFIAPGKVRRLDPSSRYAIAASIQACRAAGLAVPVADPDATDRIGSVFGSSSSGGTPVREFLEPILREGPGAAQPMVFPNTVGNAPSSYVAIELGLKGPNATLCQKEASGAHALALARDWVAEGRADAIVAGGADEVPETFYRVMDRLGALARGDGQSLPWGAGSRGFVMGEGAYALLCEAEGSPRRPLAEIAGSASAGDPVIHQRWPERVSVVARALAAAIGAAGLGPADIDLGVASANGSPGLDSVEAAAIDTLFEGRVPAVTSVKGLTGEAGGSGAASALAGVLALQQQELLPVAAVKIRADLPFAPVTTARAATIQNVLISALGSGGACAALVLARCP
ncbi:MAG: beta-ketoacyl synthase N-terminal-like domain-containing protein [Acidobacteriota bacterium]